jgi:hypothetical protein
LAVPNIQIDRLSDTWQTRQGARTPNQLPHGLRGYDAVYFAEVANGLFHLQDIIS